jgi:hypothetical protein
MANGGVNFDRIVTPTLHERDARVHLGQRDEKVQRSPSRGNQFRLR